MADFDQGGTFRLLLRASLGPSVGWFNDPYRDTLNIITAGTFQLDPSYTLVNVNVAGVVTIILPAASNPSVPAITLPGLYCDNAITIVDIGGNAMVNPITIQPAPGENIMGLASITLSSNFGGYTLLPNATLHGWNSISP
jgi:hypothetical protein